MAHQPEKLNLWDRMFNRYRKEVADRGAESRVHWRSYGGRKIEGSEYTDIHLWVEYRIIDRLTGSETIEREYLT